LHSLPPYRTALFHNRLSSLTVHRLCSVENLPWLPVWLIWVSLSKADFPITTIPYSSFNNISPSRARACSEYSLRSGSATYW
jgi:hypothetical protein